MPRVAKQRELTIDELLAVLGNPLRREILARLTQETHYPLQLSRELRVSQQAIMKHLSVLRKYRLVRCAERRSSRLGPPRKCYVSTGSFSIRIDLGPGAFEARLIPLEAGEGQGWGSGVAGGSGHAPIAELKEERGETREPAARLRELIGVLSKINREIAELESRRASLASAKQEILREACGIIAGMTDSYKERRVLYLLAEDPETPLDELAQELRVRREELERLYKMVGLDGGLI